MTIAPPRHNPALLAQVGPALALDADEHALDAAQDLARALKFLAATNRTRAEHGLRPLTKREILTEHRITQARRAARDARQNRYGK